MFPPAAGELFCKLCRSHLFRVRSQPLRQSTIKDYLKRAGEKFTEWEVIARRVPAD